MTTDSTPDAEPLALKSNEGLGAASEEHGMTNAELADAIEAAWQLQQRTYTGSATYPAICDHLRDLLRTQQARARVLTAPQPPWPVPTTPGIIGPVYVQPTWVPTPPWRPPFEVTCAAPNVAIEPAPLNEPNGGR